MHPMSKTLQNRSVAPELEGLGILAFFEGFWPFSKLKKPFSEKLIPFPNSPLQDASVAYNNISVPLKLAKWLRAPTYY